MHQLEADWQGQFATQRFAPMKAALRELRGQANRH
jgi:hypothetical protein